jgi:hypothetical protein
MAQIKAWVCSAFDLPSDTVVSINEVQCREPGCPEIEVVIGIFAPGRPPGRLRFAGPAESLRAEQIVAASRENPL